MFSDWQAISGGDASSINGVDPLLADTVLPDLHIRADSPAKDTGIVISTKIQGGIGVHVTGIQGSTDIDGHPRIVHGKISIGAEQ